MRDAIDFVHRREMARKGKEEKPAQEYSNKKEGSGAPARTTKGEKNASRQKARVGKGKASQNRRSASTKNDTAAPRKTADRNPTRKLKGRAS